MGICGKDPPPVPPIPPCTNENVAQILQLSYEHKIAPLEKRHCYEMFHTPPLCASEFKAKPMVLFLGQYSVGKTTMIKYLLGGDEYPGTRIGPEPTTDCFVVVHHAETPRTTMGTSLAADGSMPFQSLNQFGSAFLTHLRGAGMPCKLLKHLYFIDTPGILSGQKQTAAREYDFASVTRFIADKVDMIVLLFDTSKLDISDEYKLVLQNLKGNEEKIKIVLNKADMVDPGELIRVRGALMWSLSKVIDTPEVPKVYIGSFTEKQSKNSEILELFKDDYADFFKELERLPNQVVARRVNDVIKRAKSVRVHALLMDEILRQIGLLKTEGRFHTVLGDERLRAIFVDIRLKHRLAESDMPNYRLYQENALKSYFKDWKRADETLLLRIEEFLMKDISTIIEHIPHDDPSAPSIKKVFEDLIQKQKENVE
uniref:Dynamin-type G domain-containing protein n=1 Tax=Panagrellus redivivus TaxID=6233 RepID=A0A7E4ZX43_PANRE